MASSGVAGRALHEQRRVSADGRGQVLGHPCLRRAGHAEQEQCPVGGERGDGDLDDAARAHILRCDHCAIRQGATEQVHRDGPRRHPPAGRARAVVLRGQRSEFGGERVLGVRPQRLGVPSCGRLRGRTHMRRSCSRARTGRGSGRRTSGRRKQAWLGPPPARPGRPVRIWCPPCTTPLTMRSDLRKFPGEGRLSVVGSTFDVMTQQGVRWTADQVLALAPDSASRKAGSKLGAAGPWSESKQF